MIESHFHQLNKYKMEILLCSDFFLFLHTMSQKSLKSGHIYEKKVKMLRKKDKTLK